MVSNSGFNPYSFSSASGKEPSSYAEYAANQGIENSRYGEMMGDGPSLTLFGGLKESDFLPSVKTDVDYAAQKQFEKAQKDIKKIKKKIKQIKNQIKNAKEDEKKSKEESLKIQERKLKTKQMRCKSLANRLGIEYEEEKDKDEDKKGSSSSK